MFPPIALILTTLFIPIAFQAPAISQPAPTISNTAKPTPVPPPDRARAAALVRKDAIDHWNFPSSGRVTKIEAITFKDLKDVPWIYAQVPKWRITLEGNGQRLIYISNDRGGLQLLARRENLKRSKAVPRSIITAVQQSIAYANNPNYKNNPNTLQPQQVLIQSATAQQWSDGCLGVAAPHEFCTLAIEAGWRVTAQGRKGAIFTVRTDQTGQQVSADLPRPVIDRAFTLAKTWGLPDNQGRIISAEATQWGPPCLQETKTPLICNPRIISGWLIKIEDQKQRWHLRVSDGGDVAEFVKRENFAIDLDDALAKVVKREAGLHFKIAPDQVRIVNVESNIWDTCLGLAGPAETCMAGAVRGYRVTVEGKLGQTKVYRINVMSTIRAELP